MINLLPAEASSKIGRNGPNWKYDNNQTGQNELNKCILRKSSHKYLQDWIKNIKQYFVNLLQK